MIQSVQEGTVESRARINVSASPELKAAVEAAAEVLGLTAGQVVLQALVAGMPAIEAQMAAAKRLTEARKQQIHKAQPAKPLQTRK